jgi:hypothetical protein
MKWWMSSTAAGSGRRQVGETVADISTSGRLPPALPLRLQSSFLPAIVTENHRRAALVVRPVSN